jgi:hypothetical protein
MPNLNLRLDPNVALIVGGVWMLVFLITLALLLQRKDLEPIAKFMWVFVVSAVPFFGVILYWFVAPKTRRDESIAVNIAEQGRE